MLNMARRPRIGEIEQLFQRLDLLGVLDSARYCTRLVPATDLLTPAEAVGVIVAEGQPAPLNLIKAYLDLLSGLGLYDLARFRSAAVAVPVET
jgi:hypothetical protein